MSTYNYLFTEVTCPYCGQTSKTEVNLYFGNTIFMDTYAIGDHINGSHAKLSKTAAGLKMAISTGKGTPRVIVTGFYVSVIVRRTG